jgi:hypothetical protein
MIPPTDPTRGSPWPEPHLGAPDAHATREEAAAFFRKTAASSWADAAGTVALVGPA